MFALRYVYLVALVVWLGGMAVLGGVSAPATFEVLQAREPQTGRVLAGSVVGETLRRFQRVSYIAGVALLGSLAGMALLGPRPRGFAVRSMLVAAMLAVALYSGIVVTRQIASLSAEIGGPVASLPAGDPRRVRFGRLHGLSSALMMVTMAGGLALLWWEAKE